MQIKKNEGLVWKNGGRAGKKGRWSIEGIKMCIFSGMRRATAVSGRRGAPTGASWTFFCARREPAEQRQLLDERLSGREGEGGSW